MSGMYVKCVRRYSLKGQIPIAVIDMLLFGFATANINPRKNPTKDQYRRHHSGKGVLLPMDTFSLTLIGRMHIP